jgi:hypothetical protein
MPGWAILVLVAAVGAIGFGLAWWSSGRSGPFTRRELSETEKDYLSRSAWRDVP